MVFPQPGAALSNATRNFGVCPVTDGSDDDPNVGVDVAVGGVSVTAAVAATTTDCDGDDHVDDEEEEKEEEEHAKSGWC